MENAQNAGTTNNTPDSLVQVVATAENTTWVTPADNAEFKINTDASLPDIFLSLLLKLPGHMNGRGQSPGMLKLGFTKTSEKPQ